MQITVTITTDGSREFTYREIAQALEYIAKDRDLDDHDQIRSGTGYGAYVPMENVLHASWFVEY